MAAEESVNVNNLVQTIVQNPALRLFSLTKCEALCNLRKSYILLISWKESFIFFLFTSFSSQFNVNYVATLRYNLIT